MLDPSESVFEAIDMASGSVVAWESSAACSFLSSDSGRWSGLAKASLIRGKKVKSRIC